MFNLNHFYNTQSLKRYYNPGTVLCGEGSRRLVSDIIHDVPVVLVLDKHFENDAYVLELRDRYKDLVRRTIVVTGEPSSDFIDSEVRSMRGRFEWIIALGGGSAIDTAKAFSAYAAYGIYKRIGYGVHRDITDIAPGASPQIAALPTTAGSGAECSRYYLVADSMTKEKMVSRSWSVVPRVVILDPYFLAHTPKKMLVLCAFDAFAHLWETYICRYERSEFADMCSLAGIPKIFHSLNDICYRGNVSEAAISGLQYAAMLGGMNLSNVRSGIMHDAGEALAAQVAMPHPLTLIVFFEASIGHYRHEVRDREEALVRQLRIQCPGLKLNSLEDIVNFWGTLFNECAITADIRELMRAVVLDPGAIIQKILQDVVLVEKESPKPLRREDIESIVIRSLDKYKGGGVAA